MQHGASQALSLVLVCSLSLFAPLAFPAGEPNEEREGLLHGPLASDSTTWIVGENLVECFTSENSQTKKLPLRGRVITDAILSGSSELLLTANGEVIRVLQEHGELRGTTECSIAEDTFARLIGECNGVWLLGGDSETIYCMKGERRVEILKLSQLGTETTTPPTKKRRLMYSDCLGNTIYMVLKFAPRCYGYAILAPRSSTWMVPAFRSKVLPSPLALWDGEIVCLNRSFMTLSDVSGIEASSSGNISSRNVYYQVTHDTFLSQESVGGAWKSKQKALYLDIKNKRVVAESQTESVLPIGLFPRKGTVQLRSIGPLERPRLRQHPEGTEEDSWRITVP